MRFLVEHGDEFAADDLALLLGIVDAGQLGQEPLGGVDHDQVHLEGTTKERLDLYGFTCPQKTVVDEDAGQPVAHRTVDQ